MYIKIIYQQYTDTWVHDEHAPYTSRLWELKWKMTEILTGIHGLALMYTEAPHLVSWIFKIRGRTIDKKKINKQTLIDEISTMIRTVPKDWRLLPKFKDFLTLKTKDWRLAWLLWRFNSYPWMNRKQHHMQGAPIQGSLSISRSI